MSWFPVVEPSLKKCPIVTEVTEAHTRLLECSLGLGSGDGWKRHVVHFELDLKSAGNNSIHTS